MVEKHVPKDWMSIQTYQAKMYPKKNTSNKKHFEQNCVLTEIQNKQIM